MSNCKHEYQRVPCGTAIQLCHPQGKLISEPAMQEKDGGEYMPLGPFVGPEGYRITFLPRVPANSPSSGRLHRFEHQRGGR